MREQIADTQIIIHGTLCRPTPPNPAVKGTDGITDLLVHKLLRPHPGMAGKKVITLPRCLEIPKGKASQILFCDCFKGRIEPVSITTVKPGTALPKYVEAVLKIRDAKPADRLRFYANHLGHTEDEIANDALLEFALADDRDILAVASALPADQLIARLKDPETGRAYIGTLGFLLGHCSKNPARDAALLRKLIVTNQYHGTRCLLFQGLIHLQPKEGWQNVFTALSDRKKDFLYRYAALCALTFFVQTRPGVVPPDDLLAGLDAAVDQDDTADLAIERLRRWKRWDRTSLVLSLGERKSHNLPVIQRAILCFALCSPLEEAKVFVEQQRSLDPQRVLDNEEVVRAEKTPARK